MRFASAGGRGGNDGRNGGAGREAAPEGKDAGEGDGGDAGEWREETRGRCDEIEAKMEEEGFDVSTQGRGALAYALGFEGEPHDAAAVKLATTMEIAHVAAFLPRALLVGYVYNPFGARKWNSAKRGGLRGSLPAKDPPPGTTRKEPTCDSNGKTVNDCVAGGYWFTADENGDAVGFPEHHTLDCEEALRALPVSDRPVLWGENRSFALGNFSAGCVGSMCVLEIADTDGQPVLVFGCIIKMHHHLGLLEAEVSALPSASNPLCQCRREPRRSLRTYTHTPHTPPPTFTFTTAPFLLPPTPSTECV